MIHRLDGPEGVAVESQSGFGDVPLVEHDTVTDDTGSVREGGRPPVGDIAVFRLDETGDRALPAVEQSLEERGAEKAGKAREQDP